MKTQSTVRPEKFKIKDLGKVKEVILCENITETQNEEGDILYEYDMIMVTTKSQSRDDIIRYLVHLKYTHDNEISLLNKGLQNAQDVEYIAYREYVSECKSLV
jgi:ketopantoate reductase